MLGRKILLSWHWWIWNEKKTEKKLRAKKMETGKNLYGSSSKAQKKTKNVIGINVMGVFFIWQQQQKQAKKLCIKTKFVLKQLHEERKTEYNFSSSRK